MREGCICSRERDRNTPDNGNVTFPQIEALWSKRFGLIKFKKEYLFDLLENIIDWNEIYPEYYNMFLPKYRIILFEEDDNFGRDEFYSYAMTNKLDRYYGVYLDSGRLGIY